MNNEDYLERRAEDLQKLLSITKEPIKVSEMTKLIGKSRSHIQLILKANPQHFQNLGYSKGQYPGFLFQCVDDVDTKAIQASGVYKLQNDKRYHENMKLLRDNRTRLKTFISGSTLA